MIQDHIKHLEPLYLKYLSMGNLLLVIKNFIPNANLRPEQTTSMN
jgi:hypothetical protein